MELLQDIRQCQRCENLPLPPKPILQASPNSRILIAGQAPGRITREKGIPFDDPSGDRLRSWLGVSRAEFYDANNFAIVPMAFCFPGSGKSGDLPPPPLCAETWRDKLLTHLTNIELTLVIGQYAMDWHLNGEANKKRLSVTEQVKNWRTHWPHQIALPHPSPRNNRWLKNNAWFDDELVPELNQLVRRILNYQARQTNT